MSYIDAVRIKDDVLVWERTEKGRELKRYRAPYYFYTRDPAGKYTSMYGDKLSRLDFKNAREFQQAREQLESNGIELFESDIPMELKILSELYYNVPAPALNVSFLDIEVDYSKDIGFASVSNPYAPINSVAIVHMWKREYVVLAVPPNLAPLTPNNEDWQPGPAPESFIQQMHEIAELPPNMELKVTFCANETELLLELLEEIEDSDVICGWNSNLFDHPYIGKRLYNIGKKHFRRLSFPEAPDPKFKEVEVMGNAAIALDTFGRIAADYMILFRKYEMAERPSYKLESIADDILRDPITKEPTLPKLEYEGSLATLYRQNFPWFVRYNIRDTEILQGLEERLGYVELANQMMHLSTGTWKYITGTLKLAEYAVVNYCHHKLGGLVVNDFHKSENSGSIQGAFVLVPQVGMHEFIGSIDINSLYPSSIRSINISPETLMGQFVDKVKACEEIAKGSLAMLTCVFDDTTQVPSKFRNKTVTSTAEEWRNAFIELKWAVSGYGTVFSQEKQGIIPMILEDWYATRKQYQKLKAEAKAAGDKVKEMYYDKLQYTYKIKLNSFYGALTNEFFRFYDLRMGESTTGTGRMILLHQCAAACEALDGEYRLPQQIEHHGDDQSSGNVGYTSEWSVVYGDTDSSYFVTHAPDARTAILVADKVGEVVNDSFQPFMQQTFLCNPGYDDIIKCGREIVSDRGIFVDKKRYILHIIDNEGDAVDKMKVMGLDTKKTTMPKEVSIVLNKFVERLLKGEPWESIAEDIVEYKDSIKTTTDIMSIGLPKGIKKVEHYTQEYKIHKEGARLPGHVAAAIFYNQCLDEYNDKESMRIMSGMKIKVFYLSQKYGRFKSIAIPVDIEQVPRWFNEQFTVDREAHIERLVDNPLNNILRAIEKRTPTKQELMVNDLLEF
jgi:DNA polymerase elongation subunit (family B)